MSDLEFQWLGCRTGSFPAEGVAKFLVAQGDGTQGYLLAERARRSWPRILPPMPGRDSRSRRNRRLSSAEGFWGGFLSLPRVSPAAAHRASLRFLQSGSGRHSPAMAKVIYGFPSVFHFPTKAAIGQPHASGPGLNVPLGRLTLTAGTILRPCGRFLRCWMP